MTLSAADASWWADWLKFTPGWLAFVVTVGAGIRHWWIRRHKLALGPDDGELRAHLTKSRRLFDEIADKGGKLATWFRDAERQDIALHIRDQAERRTDQNLKDALERVAMMWDTAVDLAPPPIMSVHHPHLTEPIRARVQRNHDDEQLRQQVDVAQEGSALVDIALDRLNTLEWRITGR